jgi:hypothetical protein
MSQIPYIIVLSLLTVIALSMLVLCVLKRFKYTDKLKNKNRLKCSIIFASKSTELLQILHSERRYKYKK